MRAYTEQVLMPLLMAELDSMREVLEGSDVASEIAVIQNQIEEKKQAFRECIKRQFREGKLSELTASILEEEHQQEIEGLERRLQELDQIIRDRTVVMDGHKNTATALERWGTYSDAEKRISIQSVLRWVIMLPSDDFSDRPKRRGGSRTIDRKKEAHHRLAG